MGETHCGILAPKLSATITNPRKSTEYIAPFLRYLYFLTVSIFRTVSWVLVGEKTPAFDDDVWELYSPTDWTQAEDISKTNPRKLHELQRQWLIEAARHNVLPLDDRKAERMMPAWVATTSSIRPCMPEAARFFMLFSSTVLKGCASFHSGCWGAKARMRSKTKSPWK